MKLDQSFEVDAPLDRVWSALLDIERVVPDLPGAAIEGRNDDGTYDGSFKVKIGPTTAAYTGKLALENVDEAAHVATIKASGTDRRGQGGARATIVTTLEAEGDRTRVQIHTDYKITGRLASFGRGGMIEDIAERLLSDFARNLQSMLQGDPADGDQSPTGSAVEERPLDAGSLLGSVAWQRIRSSPLVPALIAMLLILTALRRRRPRT